jgi:CRISPR-associated exonuclease Cas4
MSSIKYDDESLLALSGIQHIAFCERQWALIHIERQWLENVRTVEGRHLHERVDDPFFAEARGEVFIARAVPVVSYSLGFYGVADMVEYYRGDDSTDQSTGVCLPGRQGYWCPRPVEYKRGRPKKDDWDEVQLCAQAIALEEMLGVRITSGDLFYGQTRRREQVCFTDKLRVRVQELAWRMHTMFNEGYTPEPQEGKHCKLCSLFDICMPKLKKKKNAVRAYIQKALLD